jgi:hypothetical protein
LNARNSALHVLLQAPSSLLAGLKARAYCIYSNADWLGLRSRAGRLICLPLRRQTRSVHPPPPPPSPLASQFELVTCLVGVRLFDNGGPTDGGVTEATWGSVNKPARRRRSKICCLRCWPAGAAIQPTYLLSGCNRVLSGAK